VFNLTGTNSTGLLPPGARSPSYRDSVGGGGIGGSYDATRLVGPNQSLKFFGSFNFSQDNVGYGTSPVGLASAATLRQDIYAFGGGFRYGIGTSYLTGGAGSYFGNGSEFRTFNGSTGSFTSNGYSTGLGVGHAFTLLNALSFRKASRFATKAPPKPAGGYIIGLDVGAHLGYANERDNGFTDSSGFVFGNEQVKFGDVGGQAKLFALIMGNGLFWMPYVAGTIDQRFGYSHTLSIPTQVALAGGDIFSFAEGNTFFGTKLGLDVYAPGRWTVGVKGFYTASSDTTIAGGNVYLRIPFGYTPLAAARY
jgi:hypothetical protein